jgi:hypothetical protein
MPNGEHAAVQAMKAARPDPVRDRVVVYPEAEELSPRDHAVLAGGERCDLAIAGTRERFR